MGQPSAKVPQRSVAYDPVGLPGWLPTAPEPDARVDGIRGAPRWRMHAGAIVGATAILTYLGRSLSTVGAAASSSGVDAQLASRWSDWWDGEPGSAEYMSSFWPGSPSRSSVSKSRVRSP